MEIVWIFRLRDCVLQFHPIAYSSKYTQPVPSFSVGDSQKKDGMKTLKIDKMLTQISGHEFGADSGPGERSGGIQTGNLQEITARTLWDYSRGPKPENPGHKSTKMLDLPGFRAEIINY